MASVTTPRAKTFARLGAAQYDAKLEQYSVLIMPTIKIRPSKIPPAGLKEKGKGTKRKLSTHASFIPSQLQVFMIFGIVKGFKRMGGYNRYTYPASE